MIEQFLSSTEVVYVATDAGNGYLKGMGNRQGNESLASELVGSELAAAVGLTVPPFAIIDIGGLEIVTRTGRVLEPGPAFISRAQEMVVAADPAGSCLPRMRNRSDLSLLIAFDTWVRNLDRCPPPDHLMPEPNRDNLLFRARSGWFDLLAVDHTHCFILEGLEDGLAGDAFVEDSRVYGAFPEFMPYLSEADLRGACDKIKAIDEDAVMEIIAGVPPGWGPSLAVRERWASQIVNRAERVEEYVISALVDQGQLGI